MIREVLDGVMRSTTAARFVPVATRAVHCIGCSSGKASDIL